MFLNLSMRLMSFSSSIIFDSRCSLRAFCDMVSRMSGRAWYSRCSWSHVLLRPWMVKAKRETGWCRCLVCICFSKVPLQTDFLLSVFAYLQDRFSLLNRHVCHGCLLSLFFQEVVVFFEGFLLVFNALLQVFGEFSKMLQKARGNVYFLPRQNRQNYLFECFFYKHLKEEKKIPSFWSTWEQALNSQEAACLPWWSSHWQAVASWAQLWLSWWSSSW